MKEKIIKTLHIYAFALLFILGVGISAVINDSGVNAFPFVETANAGMTLEEGDCDGYKQARKDDVHILTMCNCTTQEAIGLVGCGEDDEVEG